MFHPANWKRISPALYEVGDFLVSKSQRTGEWFCCCEQDTFRAGGKKQQACKHTRFVVRKEKQKFELSKKFVKKQESEINESRETT